MGKAKVFLDTDVLVSSIISKTGASYAITSNPKIQKSVSKTVVDELEEVSKRLNLDNKKKRLVLKNIKIDTVKLSKKPLLEMYGEFVSDEEDAHVVAGAHRMKVKFLLTHNTKHYNVDRISARLGIIALKPGNFLQYLRSQEKSKI